MLYVIETATDGAVRNVRACDNGIDEAIRYIAGALTREEEDGDVSFDVVSAAWEDAVALGGPDEIGVLSRFSISRKGFGQRRYGLAVID